MYHNIMENQSRILVQLFALHLRFICVEMKSQGKAKKSQSVLPTGFRVFLTCAMYVSS